MITSKGENMTDQFGIHLLSIVSFPDYGLISSVECHQLSYLVKPISLLLHIPPP